MALKEVSIVLGIMAGTAGIANSGYGLYNNFIVKPSKNAEYNRNLMMETPLVVETVEIQPVTDLAMRVEVTVKIFKTGDILVESGNRRQYIMFKLSNDTAVLDKFITTAVASETQQAQGVDYDLIEMRYLESVKLLPDNNMERVRTYADGSVETSIIDMRSNQVLKTTNSQKTLSDNQRKAIEASPYKKKIFVPKQSGKSK
jgi:hypothetical protein